MMQYYHLAGWLFSSLPEWAPPAFPAQLRSEAWTSGYSGGGAEKKNFLNNNFWSGEESRGSESCACWQPGKINRDRMAQGEGEKNNKPWSSLVHNNTELLDFQNFTDEQPWGIFSHFHTNLITFLYSLQLPWYPQNSQGIQLSYTASRTASL